MTNRDQRLQATEWKVLRTGLTAMTDDDWADDISDTLPTAANRGKVPFHRIESAGNTTQVEFIVWAYVDSTGLLVDLGGETFTATPHFIHETTSDKRPIGPHGQESEILGRASADESVISAHQPLTLCEFSRHYRFECDGARAFTIRLITLSATPTGADRFEVWYRQVFE